MKSVKAVAALGLAVAATLGAAALDASGSARSASSTLMLTAAPRGVNMVDVAKRGPSIGDQVLESGVISGDATGTFSVIGQLISGNTRRGTEHSVLSLQLRDGEIEAAGSHGLVERFTLAVVGGTGQYAGAHGTVSLSPATGEKVKLVANLD